MSIFIASCLSSGNFGSGSEAFRQKHYFTAITLLKTEIDRAKMKSDAFEKTYLIAESFRLMNLPDSAVLWYKKALEIADDEIAYINLAREFKKTEDYVRAIEALEQSKRIFGNTQLVQRELSICRQAIDLIDKPRQEVSIEKLNASTRFSEFVSDINGDKIFISSDRNNNSKDRYGWTGNFYYDIFLMNTLNADNVEILKGKVNSKFNESSASLSSDGRLMYFVRCGEEGKELSNCFIYLTRLENGIWTDAEKLPFQKDGTNYVSPRITNDGSRLYFTSDATSGYGGYDIYFVTKTENGWVGPVRLPNIINTPGNENFVTIWKNEIYFSSDYISGLGGLDIFSTSIDSSGNFTPPQNLKPPVNSGGDDFYLLKKTDSTGYFSSSRKGAQGLDDIYRFTIGLKRDTVLAKNNPVDKIQTVKKDKKLYLAIRVMENVYSISDDPNSKVLGKKPVSDAVVKTIGIADMVTDAGGVVLRQISFDTSFSISVGKNGYLTSNQVVTLEKENFYKEEINTVNIRVVIEKIYLDKEIVLRNIYYDFDKWDIRRESEQTLNVLFNILKNNPQYKVNIGSHTDCRGEEDYNMELSQKRAQSVVDYLISKGLSSERIKAVGYGESILIDKCNCENCTEDQHQNNRRTTFELKSQL